MNGSFILFDKNNNLQRIANVIVKFNFEGINYLIYSVDENEQNCQIFVSKLILNSEGKYFIDNIMPEEKRKLNNIVYNIVILLPVEVQKGNTFDKLVGNLFDKFSVKLSLGDPITETQEYYSNCSIAVTSKLLVEGAVKLYKENLDNVLESSSTPIPTWTAPLEVTAPMEASVEVNAGNVKTNSVSTATLPVQETTVISDLNSKVDSSSAIAISSSDVQTFSSSVPPVVNTNQIVSNSGMSMNPQLEKLAIVSDPSLASAGMNVRQPNVGKLKKAGFANTKYVVIGTVCLLLAVAVVVTAFILIKNMK